MGQQPNSAYSTSCHLLRTTSQLGPTIWRSRRTSSRLEVPWHPQLVDPSSSGTPQRVRVRVLVCSSSRVLSMDSHMVLLSRRDKETITVWMPTWMVRDWWIYSHQQPWWIESRDRWGLRRRVPLRWETRMGRRQDLTLRTRAAGKASRTSLDRNITNRQRMGRWEVCPIRRVTRWVEASKIVCSRTTTIYRSLTKLVLTSK